MAAYNGHRSWNAWNVALWIGNDEGLYRTAIYYLDHSKNAKAAARKMLADLPATTPDGAKYNLTCVYEAIKDLRD